MADDIWLIHLHKQRLLIEIVCIKPDNSPISVTGRPLPSQLPLTVMTTHDIEPGQPCMKDVINYKSKQNLKLKLLSPQKMELLHCSVI